jgi:hypothetical protein
MRTREDIESDHDALLIRTAADLDRLAIEHEQTAGCLTSRAIAWRAQAIRLRESRAVEVSDIDRGADMNHQRRTEMDTWRKVWRVGFAPQFSVDQLRDLRAALVRDDPKLLQGATTCPPPMECVQDWPPEGACLAGWVGWHTGDGLTTVGEVEVFFAETCFKADQLLQEVAGCRYFLNWFDDTPRDEMRPLLIAEIDRELAQRFIPADRTDLLAVT